MKTISTPKPQHHCTLPDSYQQRIEIGTLHRCSECGRLWRFRPGFFLTLSVWDYAPIWARAWNWWRTRRSGLVGPDESAEHGQSPPAGKEINP